MRKISIGSRAESSHYHRADLRSARQCELDAFWMFAQSLGAFKLFDIMLLMTDEEALQAIRKAPQIRAARII